ncbi:hypothetical protein PG993_003001 [Apiospora rasikravindrae]|uniref:Protein kinase domain-containing protein n=1 Tax=Apiospora rasikravindrae TaxID=990691 RepID=A0ABR1TY82_9PEZI
MTQPLESPYIEGNILTLKIHRLGNKHAPPQLNRDARELKAKIIDVVGSSDWSIVVVLELEPEAQTASAAASRAVLKVYDRQFSQRLRRFHDSVFETTAGPATSESEIQYTAFLRQGFMPQFLAHHADVNKPWPFEEWDMPKREAYFYAECANRHDRELAVYDRLIDVQGIHIPTLFADVRLAAQQPAATTAGTRLLDENLTKYSEIPAILIEYIPGFPLSDLFKETPESDWPVLCNQAVETVRKIIKDDFRHLDMDLGHGLVVRRRGNHEKGEAWPPSSYQVFYIDFALCEFRDADDRSDEEWRERKRAACEEGGVGYLLANHWSYAKGKNGKRYKGSIPLPWTYTPAMSFGGEPLESILPAHRSPSEQTQRMEAHQ